MFGCFSFHACQSGVWFQFVFSFAKFFVCEKFQSSQLVSYHYFHFWERIYDFSFHTFSSLLHCVFKTVLNIRIFEFECSWKLVLPSHLLRNLYGMIASYFWFPINSLFVFSFQLFVGSVFFFRLHFLRKIFWI